MHCDLAVNVCTCHNGVGQTGVGCPATGAPKCASCNVGLRLSHDQTKCLGTCANARDDTFTLCRHVSLFCCNENMRMRNVILCACMHCDLAVNVCTCHNGVPQAGAGCPFSGAPKCASCNVGFTISHDGTKCARTCVGCDVRGQTRACADVYMYALRMHRQRVRMQKRRGANWRGLSCHWCGEMRVVQRRVHNQSRENKVYSYVCLYVRLCVRTILHV